MKEVMLFVCTGNSARSQMAEGLLRKHAGDRFDVYSAGLEAHGINPLTVRVLDEIGIDTSAHTSDEIFAYIGKIQPDYLVTVCSHAEKNCPHVWPGKTTRLHWPFDDPATATGSDEHRLDEFRRVRIEIERRIVEWLASPVAVTPAQPSTTLS
jgi:arsenate reductase